MTTFEPGASDVFTHGLTVRPRSTALRASRPAPIITDGLEVFVHDVIAAITTWPWSSSVSVPSASVTGDDDLGAVGDLRAAGARARVLVGVARIVVVRAVGGGRVGGREGLLAGLVLAALVLLASGRKPSSAIRNDALDSVSETRSCGRLGPASDGTTSPRSSSSVSE